MEFKILVPFLEINIEDIDSKLEIILQSGIPETKKYNNELRI